MAANTAWSDLAHPKKVIMDLFALKESFKKLKETLGKPLTIYSLLTIFFSGYIILRVFGIDILPPMLNKIGIGTLNNSGVDINGNYVYESFGMDSAHLGYFHGGYFHIEQNVSALGIRFGLAGYRTWRKFKGKPKEDITFPWSSEWGGIFDGNKIKFTYNIIATNGEKIKGYVEGDIHTEKNGKAEEILCNFYILPPSNPMYGSMIIRKMDKEEITKADVFEIVPITY
jgi:hypothetical protein